MSGGQPKSSNTAQNLYPVNKDWAIFDKYGRETNGEYTACTVSVMPGGQNAAHWHGSYAETFTADKGSVGIYSKSTGKIMLAPGESHTVPPGEVHYFFNPGNEDVEMKVRMEPAHEGFEMALYILYGLARDGKCVKGGAPKNLMHLAVVLCMADMWLPGVGGLIMTPIIRALAWVGWAIGIEEQLVQTYWVDDGIRPKRS